MNIKRSTITISRSEADRITALLCEEPSCESECFGEDEKITHTAVFDDGYEADIEVCGVQYVEGECNTAWSQGVLFKNGSEVCCSEPSDEFLGEWEFETNDTTYIVNVVTEEE